MRDKRQNRRRSQLQTETLATLSGAAFFGERKQVSFMELEQAAQLHDFLMGGQPPDGITLKRRPRKMTAEQSMAVIYVLQEAFHLIPDTFELCSNCRNLFDTDSDGHMGENGKNFCDYCSHLCKCEDCKRLGADRD